MNNRYMSNNIERNATWRVGVYCRLSKDDELTGESASISNQRDILVNYCQSQGWQVVDVFQDDGYTGLNTDRPDLQRLLKACEKGLVNLVIPGGMPGTKYLEEYKPLTELLTDFYQNGGKVAAICAAPGIFERLGFLKGRNATSYPSVMEQLKSARTSLEPVVVDGNVTTSRGLGTAIDFSLSLIGQLEGSAKAEEIAESVVYVRA